MRQSKPSDGIVVLVTVITFVAAVGLGSIAAAIVFAVIFAEDCFTQWLAFKRETKDGAA